MSASEPKFSAKENDTHEATLILAHRGFTKEHLENTKLALSSAFTMGADGVEFDVQLTKDLVPVVFHDRSLYRLVGIRKNIDEISVKELKTLKQKSKRYPESYPISTLDEILQAMPKGKLINIELKETTALHGSDGMKRVLLAIEPYKDKLTMVISSFDKDILAMVYALDKDYNLGYLVDNEADLLRYLEGDMVTETIKYLHPHLNLLTKKNAQMIKDKSIKLLLWGHKRLSEEDAFIADKHVALISDVSEDLLKKYRKCESSDRTHRHPRA